MAIYAERAAQAYCDRWQTETSFFVMKQEFALEKARVRTFRRLEDIFSLCVLAYVYATQLLRRTKGFRKILKFLADNLETVSAKTHALLAGIRALVKETRIRFVSGRLRKRMADDGQMALPGFWGGRQGRFRRDSARYNVERTFFQTVKRLRSLTTGYRRGRLANMPTSALAL